VHLPRFTLVKLKASSATNKVRAFNTGYVMKFLKLQTEFKQKKINQHINHAYRNSRNIGAGKTTLTELLSKHFGWSHIMRTLKLIHT